MRPAPSPPPPPRSWWRGGASSGRASPRENVAIAQDALPVPLALESLQRFPLDRIAYVHVGGGRFRDGVYHDTHADPVVPGVLHLVEELFALTDAPGVMLERDDDFAPEAEFAAELRAIADAVRRGGEQRVRA